MSYFNTQPAKNGILAYVGGDYIAQGRRMLPAADPGETASRSVVLDVPNLGPVRITYQLSSYRHYKNKFWHWVAEHAERAEPSAPI